MMYHSLNAKSSLSVYCINYTYQKVLILRNVLPHLKSITIIYSRYIDSQNVVQSDGGLDT